MNTQLLYLTKVKYVYYSRLIQVYTLTWSNNEYSYQYLYTKIEVCGKY